MIINLTQHRETPEQEQAGVFIPDLLLGDEEQVTRARIAHQLNFTDLPTASQIADACNNLQALCQTIRAEYPDAKSVMIGGAPWLMPLLETSLRNAGFRVVYAFSVRESVDQVQADGSVRKVAVFRHAGFVETPDASTPLHLLTTREA